MANYRIGIGSFVIFLQRWLSKLYHPPPLLYMSKAIESFSVIFLRIACLHSLTNKMGFKMRRDVLQSLHYPHTVSYTHLTLPTNREV